MRIVGYLIIGIVAFSGFFVFKLPAASVVHYVLPANANLRLAGVAGTTYAGEVASLSWRTTPLGRLDWAWQAHALLQKKFAYQLQLQGPDTQLSGQAGINLKRELGLKDLRGSVPLSTIVALLQNIFLPVSGQIELELNQLTIDATGFPRSADGLIRLRDAEATLIGALPLGNYRALLRTEAQIIAAEFSDEGGPLALSGVLTLTPDGRYRVQGEISQRPGAPAALGPALALIGRPGPDGQRQFDLSGRIE